MLKEQIQKTRNDYAQQFGATSQTIQQLQNQLAVENKRLEQLRGAVVALDTLEGQLTAGEKAAAAKEAAPAATEEKPAEAAPAAEAPAEATKEAADGEKASA